MNIADIPGRDQVFLNPWLGDYLISNFIKHSDLARSMHLDPSIITLWVSGQRPVPHNRLEALAAALDLSLDEVLSHALTVEGGYFHRTYRRAQPLVDVTPVVRFEIAAPPKPEVPPSEIRLQWCKSTHGAGVQRWHNHGPVSVLGPLGSIAEWTRERDPKPYVRPQSVFPHVVWPTHSPPVPAPVSEPAEIEARPAAPQRDFGHDVLIDPTQWKDDREIPLAGPPKAPTEEVQQTHIRRAQVRRVREVVEAPFVTAHHRGHLALGMACRCETS